MTAGAPLIARDERLGPRRIADARRFRAGGMQLAKWVILIRCRGRIEKGPLMSRAALRFRVPIAIQVGVVAALFIAALAVLWMTGASLVSRERRRSEAKATLDRAGQDLAAGGRGIIAQVARIVIPPLRDRPEDIPPLAEHILRRVERRHGCGELSLSPEALAVLQNRPWPGNVRQLENALARAAIVARGRTILPEHLDAEEPLDPAIPASGDAALDLPLRALLAEVERRAIHRALLAYRGNRTKTAERLGISRGRLFDKIREYDLHP
jgi:hypothetical protein